MPDTKAQSGEFFRTALHEAASRILRAVLQEIRDECGGRATDPDLFPNISIRWGNVIEHADAEGRKGREGVVHFTFPRTPIQADTQLLMIQYGTSWLPQRGRCIIYEAGQPRWEFEAQFQISVSTRLSRFKLRRVFPASLDRVLA